MLARPATHGLVGVRDVDEQIIDEALVKFDAGLRLFHLHAEGMGLVIIATTMTAATLARPGAGSPRASSSFSTAGGAGYPFGYLLWGALIPYHGLADGQGDRRVAGLDPLRRRDHRGDLVARGRGRRAPASRRA